MSYPAGIDVFTTKVDGVDSYLAAHMNAVQSAVVAVETELGTGLRGTLASLAARLAVGLNNDGTLKTAGISSLPANTVDTAAIQGLAVTAAKIAANTITAAQIAAKTITAAQIADGTIGALQIGAGAVGTTQLGAAAVQTVNIGDAQVTDAKIVAMDAAKLTGTVSNSRLTTATSGTPGIVQLETDGGVTAGRAVDGSDSRLKRGCSIALCAGFTPTGTGADTAEFVVPFDPKDGTTSVTWNVRRIDFRVQTAGGAPSVTVEKSTVSGAFSAATVGTVTLGSGNSEGSNTSSLGTVASGDKLRFNVATLATATNWTVEVLLGL